MSHSRRDVSESDVQTSDRIKVVCHGCGARYKVRSQRVRGKQFHATCKRCGGIIVARCTNAFTVLPEKKLVSVSGELEVREEGRPTDEATVKREGARGDAAGQSEGESGPGAGWYAVLKGKPHGPLSESQIRKYFEEGKISERTYIWKSGDSKWCRLEEVRRFSDLLAEDPTQFYQQSLEVSVLSDDDWATAEKEPLDLKPRARAAEAGSPWPRNPVPEAQQDATEQTTVHHPASQETPPPEAEEPTHYRYAAPRGFAGNAGAEARAPRSAAPEPGSAAHGSVEAGQTLQGGWDRGASGRAPAEPAAWPQLPAPVAPRQAWLPAPTGMPRHKPTLQLVPPPSPVPEALAPSLFRPTGPPSPMPPEPPREEAPPMALGGPPVASEAPPPSPAPSAPALPPPSVPEDSSVIPLPLLPVPDDPLAQYPPASEAMDLSAGAMLRAIKEPFWTTGKIIAVAAIGGGLAVASMIMLGVYLTRSMPQVPEERPAPAAVSGPKVAPPASRSAPAPAAKAPGGPAVATRTPASTPVPAKAEKIEKVKNEVKTELAVKNTQTAERAKPVSSAPAPAARTETPAPASSARRAEAPVSSAPRSRPRSTGTPTSGAEAILAVGSRKRTAPSSAAAPKSSGSSGGADDILAAGSRRRSADTPSSASGGDNANDILAAGSRRRSTGSSSSASGSDGANDILAAGSRRKGRTASDSSSSAAPAEKLPLYPSRTQIQNTMKLTLPRVRSCYDKYHVPGVITVNVLLKPDGTAESTVVGEFSGTATAFCVLAGVNQLRFPRFSGHPIRFNYPFKLN